MDTSAAAVEARRRELLGTRDRLTQKEGEEEADAEASANGMSTLGGDFLFTLPGTATLTFEPGKNPIPALQAYFATSPEAQICLQEVQNAAAKVRWSETQTMKAVVASLFDPAHIRVGFYKKCDTLAPVRFLYQSSP